MSVKIGFKNPIWLFHILTEFYHGKCSKKYYFFASILGENMEKFTKEECKTLSALIQEATRLIKKERLKKEFYEIQNFWTEKAKEKEITIEEDLER